MSSLLADQGADGSELIFTAFNQDSGCFACGMSNGFIIYNVEPFKETFRRIFPNGGIGIVEMLFRCNLLAIVGGGRNPRYPTNKVMMWDDNQSKCIGELKFRTEVKAVRMRKDRIVVVLDIRVFVYRLKDLALQDQITTVNNPKGLVSLSVDMNSTVLAIPGLTKGSVRVELYDIGKVTIIKAHESDLAYFVLNSDGSKLATASDKGTLIRIWNTHSGEALREFRRGMDRAEIYCIAFDLTDTYCACSSDKGTVHLYSLVSKQGQHGQGAEPPEVVGETGAAAGGGGFRNSSAEVGDESTLGAGAGSTEPNHQHTVQYNERTVSADTATTPGGGSNKQMGGMGVNFLKSILPTSLVPKYIDSVWSFAQVRGIDGRSICSFTRDSSRILVVCADGTFVVASVEEAPGGDCKRLSTTRFLDDPAILADLAPRTTATPAATAPATVGTKATGAGGPLPPSKQQPQPR